MNKQIAFQIERSDNVATALIPLEIGNVRLRGDSSQEEIIAKQEIPMGHKIALHDIGCGEDIIKYGIVIGRATEDITNGTWVHLHCMQSLYDERSNHLDAVTGAPKDTKYE